MRKYAELCHFILNNGEVREDRTGTGTISSFDHQLVFNLEEGFPLLGMKYVPFRLVASEFEWMIKGRTNVRDLMSNNNNIWNEWAFMKWYSSKDYNGPTIMKFDNSNKDFVEQMQQFKYNVLSDELFAAIYGELGPVYGAQWRDWDGKVDQLKNVVDIIMESPTDRRMLVSAWNPGDLPKMALPPCHYAFQFYVRSSGHLDLKFHQRSADVFLGLPFDIASYALMVHTVANITDLVPGRLIADLGDTHIYLNHVEQVKELLTREMPELPQLTCNRKFKSLDDVDVSEFVLHDYNHSGVLKGEVSV